MGRLRGFFTEGGSMPKSRYKYGRNPSAPRDLARSLHLDSFLKAGYVGTVPDTVSYTPDAKSLPMDGNDQLGDCTAAAAAHVTTAITQFGQGTPAVPSLNDVIAFYSGSTGYVPGNPNTDQGGDMQTVQKYWNQTGIAGHKIAAYFAVDPKDFDGMRAALYLFGNLYIGFNVTQGFENAFSRGQVFDYIRRDRVLGGHCVGVHKKVKGGNFTLSTWGGLLEMTEAAWTAWVDEPYAVVSQEWVKNNLTPEGLDVNAANAAFTQVTGRPGPFISTGPTPIPVPVPVPTPTPTPGPDTNAADVALYTAVAAALASGKTVEAAFGAWSAEHGFTGADPHVHGR